MPIDPDKKFKNLQTEIATLKAENREFIYTVTHDLIGPFRQIEGFANMILTNHGDQFDDKTKRHFDLILSGSQKGKDILEALHGYSRLVNAELATGPVNCNDILTEVETDLATLIQQTAAQVSYKNIPPVTGDYGQLYQLFYQLIHNALHYQSVESTPKISITADETDYHWQFCIQDNGLGFREKLADKVFNALKRGVSDKDYTGIGMGLTIAKSIVQQHGGKIWVTTEQGIGSSFYFTISKVV